MSSFSGFFYFFSSLALLLSVLVVTSKNPVYSVLFLILTFCNVSALLFLLNIEFLPVIFIVVYVGAIAVLFLFVMMMLNVKFSEMQVTTTYFMQTAFILATTFLLEVWALTRLDFVPLTVSNFHSSFLSDLSSQSVGGLGARLLHQNESNIQSIGQALFVDLWPQFIIVGYVLLFAMVGVIVLTLQKTFLSKTQNVYFQTIRDFNSCVTFYR